jgi:tetratricopeptide (TPR) repeat protein
MRFRVKLAGACYFLVLTMLGVIAVVPLYAQLVAGSDPRDELEAAGRAADALRAEHDRLAARLANEFPDDYDALRILGYIHSSQGRMEQMVDCWRRCRDLKPDRAEIHDQLGRYAAQQEDYDTAIASWQTALQLDPQLPQVRKNIGFALLNSGRTAEAVAMLESELAISPGLAEAHYYLGEAHFQLGELPRAKEHYGKALERKPEDANSLYGLVKSCIRMGEAEAAARYQEEFQKLQQQLTTNDVQARQAYDDLQMMRERLAVSYVDAGRLDATHDQASRALEQWQRAVEVDPKYLPAHRVLAEHYTRTDDAPRLLRHLTALAELDPGPPDHLIRLGFLHARLGNLKAAETALRRAVQQHPRDAASYRALAKFYLNTKRESAVAQKLAAAAVQLDPGAESHFVLGWANATIGDRDGAERALQKALQIDPANKMYRQLYEMVQSRD